MNKRLLAAVLWFLTGWYLGGYVSLLGVPEIVGPILGLAGAAFFGGDPLGIIWTKKAEPATITTLDLENLPDDLAQAA